MSTDYSSSLLFPPGQVAEERLDKFPAERTEFLKTLLPGGANRARLEAVHRNTGLLLETSHLPDSDPTILKTLFGDMLGLVITVTQAMQEASIVPIETLKTKYESELKELFEQNLSIKNLTLKQAKGSRPVITAEFNNRAKLNFNFRRYTFQNFLQGQDVQIHISRSGWSERVVLTKNLSELPATYQQQIKDFIAKIPEPLKPTN